MARAERSVRARALVAATLISLPHAAAAYDSERARAYFAQELAQCGAWYRLVAEAPGVDEIDRIKFRAAGISLVSTSADLTSESWALAQMEIATATIRREMRDSWRNYPVVDKKYRLLCWSVATDPVARRKYWLDKHG
jgi:hypothetical protein